MDFVKTPLFVSLPRINFLAVWQELIFWVGFGTFLYAVGKFLDYEIFYWVEPLRNQWLDQVAVFSTEKLLYIVFGVFALFTLWRILRNPSHHSKMVPALFAVVTTWILVYILKSLFAVHRPFVGTELEALIPAAGYSFPSGHTAVCFALLIPFWRVSKLLGLAWALFAIFIGLSRVYEHVHFPSDIAAGVFVGGVIGAFFSHPEMHKYLASLWEQSLEFRRQTFHFIAGFLLVFAHWKGLLRIREIALFLVLGLIFSFLSQHQKAFGLSEILKLFDRPRDQGFPGRGAFYFLLGILLCFIFFPVKIAYASILILSTGDSFNHFFASKLHKGGRFFWNKKKSLLGMMIGVLCGTFASQFFVPLSHALVASTVAIFLETIPFRIGKFYIDDNVFVPLVAGGILMLLAG